MSQTNPLLQDITTEQRGLLGLLGSTFRERGHWPPWQYVEATLERGGLDPVALVTDLPSVGTQRGVYGLTYGLVWTRGTFGSLYQPGDPIGLTIAGWQQVGETKVVDVFLRVLGMAARKLNEFTPDPEGPVSIQLTSPEVVDSLGTALTEALPLGVRQLYQILEAEPSMWGGSRGITDTGEWRWELSRSQRPYRHIKSAEGYLDIVKSLADEVAKEVEHLPIVQATMTPSSTVYTHGAHERVTQPGSGDAKKPGDQALLFLSWGRKTGKRIAEILKPVLEDKLPGVEVFFSPVSIEPGDDPLSRMFDDSLLRSRALVVVLTREGADSAYVVWETAAAWAKGQLVIPMFVDIEPGEVPGPLTTKVQGVRLDDRADVERAIARLVDYFATDNDGRLTDAQWETLSSTRAAAAAGPTERPPVPKSPKPPNSLMTDEVIVAVSSAKDFLSSGNTIRLHDLIASNFKSAKTKIGEWPMNGDRDDLLAIVGRIDEAMIVPTALVEMCAYYGDEASDRFWLPTLTEWAVPKIAAGLTVFIDLLYYPASCIMYSAGLGLLGAGRLGTLERILGTTITVPTSGKQGPYSSELSVRRSLSGLVQRTPADLTSQHIHDILVPQLEVVLLLSHEAVLSLYDRFELLLFLVSSDGLDNGLDAYNLTMGSIRSAGSMLHLRARPVVELETESKNGVHPWTAAGLFGSDQDRLAQLMDKFDNYFSATHPPFGLRA